jgi:hypothetical protein
MYRGTTPELELEFDFSLSGQTELFITFAQNNHEVFTLEIGDLTIADNIAKVRLTQEQTLMLNAEDVVDIQARGKQGDIAWATDIIRKNVGDILKDGVI